jgi:hypothetical protein
MKATDDGNIIGLLVERIFTALIVLHPTNQGIPSAVKYQKTFLPYDGTRLKL